MPPPAPPIPIKDGCSVIHDGTLYVYTPDAFQSLELSEGAKWKRLPENAADVKGAVCVLGAPNGDDSKAAMFLVGGTTTNENYSGLSRWSFSDQSWAGVQPEVPVTQNRVSHGATYLNASSSILIYAGGQGDSSTGPSSQTFLVSVEAPYGVLSFPSTAPPVTNPTLLPWSNESALMVGGDQGNDKAWTFDPTSGWANLPVTLNPALPSKSKAQPAIVFGDDGSKTLEVFDMSVSPNTVTRTVLTGDSSTFGKLRRSTRFHRSQASGPPPTKRVKRDLSVTNWPEYNGTYAPDATRSGFSVASDPLGRVVVSGGNKEDPLCIFDARENSWLNATDLLVSKVQTQGDDKPTQTSSSTSAATASSSSSSTSKPAAQNPRGTAIKILGATLGGIFGLAVVLFILLLFLRWRRRKRRYDEAGHQRRASGLQDEKDRMSFADRGASFMSEAGGFVKGGAWGRNETRESATSVGIVSGRSGPKKSIFAKLDGNNHGNPDAISANAVPLQQRPTERRAEVTVPARANPAVLRPAVDGAGKQRSSGWSRYFSGNSATSLVHSNSGRSAHSTPSQETPLRESATVAPLTVGAGRSRAAAAEDPNAKDDAFSSGIPASVHEDNQWTPVAAGQSSNWNKSRGESSVYTASNRGSVLPRNYGAGGAGLAFPRNSSAETAFPRGAPGGGDRITKMEDFQTAGGAGRGSDMSWLKLGSGNR